MAILNIVTYSGEKNPNQPTKKTQPHETIKGNKWTKPEMVHMEEKDVRGSFEIPPIRSFLLNIIAVQQINSLTIQFTDYTDLGTIENKEITQIDQTGIRRAQ